ncbi:phosphoglycolate phosphatase [Streptacidiphilus sp. MAP12-16]|uniref:HAD family hydrolase n=1 Tax=Streptacidiphilus sp. MAP12-16 TaxID=3156300 RepID=UPI00351154DE
MPLIVLWDIDHTLIENSGVSKEIYAAAFTALAGQLSREPAVTEGRTDRLIMAEMFRRHGLSVPPWEQVARALEEAGAGREDDLRRRGRALPGTREVLKALAGVNWAVSSVLTGNIAANALVKLRAFDLNILLDLTVGAYGADSEDRAGLVAVARQRIGAAYGLASDTPVVLVGDTPRDVEAALATGSKVVAVATGVNGAQELREAGAEVVLPDLCDTAGLISQLRSWATG